MALAPRPIWDPLPDPPGPDPAHASDFRILAAGDMSPLEAAAAQVGVQMASVELVRVQAELAADALGRDIAAGAVKLSALQGEAAADTLVPELSAAAQQDAALAALESDVGVALGATPGAPATFADVPPPTPVLPPQALPSSGPTIATGRPITQPSSLGGTVKWR